MVNNQVSTYKTEKGELYSQVMQFEKKFDKTNFRYRMWGFLKRNAIRGFWPLCGLENFFLILLNMFFRCLIMVILFCIYQDLIACLLIYAIPHIVVIIATAIAENNALKKLQALEIEINEKYEMYAEKQYSQYCITNKDSVVFDNGLQVTNGLIRFPLSRDFGSITIFQLSDQADKNNFNYIKDEISDGDSDFALISKHIPSIQFTKNFGVITDKDNVIQALNYLSPTVQINMINHINELKNYTRIHAVNGLMDLGTNRYVEPPEKFYILDKYSSVIRYFDEIDRYCQELLGMAYKAFNELQQLEFLKGNT